MTADRPRLIYYQDAHHFHAKRLDSPVNIPKLQWPVDELLGTGVDVLAFGLGYGDVYFHDSKVGRVVGQMEDVWDSYIDWRIMRMVKDARELGADQVRMVIERGKEKSLRVFPSLKLQSCDRPGSDRCGLLKWNHPDEVCMLEKDEFHSRYEWCYDYANPLVREDKINILREIMTDYEAVGVELDFMFVPKFFKTGEEERNTQVMTAFIEEVRRMADEIGSKQGRKVAVSARVFHQRDANLRLGLDVETWIKNGSLDIVVGQMSEQFMDTGAFDLRWLVDAAQASETATYVRPTRRVYDERTAVPTIEMYRAFGQTARRQGIDGLYLGYLRWPFSQVECEILRDAAYPDAFARRDKRYLLQPQESGLVLEELVDYQGGYPKKPHRTEDEITDPPERYLPADLIEGETVSVSIVVSDDLESARADGELRKPILTLRFSQYCVEDEIEFRFNGDVLPIEKADVTDELAVTMPVSPRGSPFDGPLGVSAHWFRFRLEVDTLHEGKNVVEVETKRVDKLAGFTRSLNGVEIQTRYKDFVRPESFDAERLAPRW
jgi:uncharacterized lipoprotein YddW (UPF0748 family)